MLMMILEVTLYRAKSLDSMILVEPSDSGYSVILQNNFLTFFVHIHPFVVFFFILKSLRNCILRLPSSREKAARCKEMTKKEKRNYQHALESLNLLEQKKSRTIRKIHEYGRLSP